MEWALCSESENMYLDEKCKKSCNMEQTKTTASRFDLARNLLWMKYTTNPAVLPKKWNRKVMHQTTLFSVNF